MDIAALSIAMSQSQMQQSVGVSMAKKVMEVQEIQCDQLVESIQSATPPTDHALDIKV